MNKLSTKKLLKMKIDKIPSFVDGLLPQGQISCLVGKSELGKSTLLRKLGLQIVKQVTERPIGIDYASRMVNLSPSQNYKLTISRRIPFHRRPSTKKLNFFESELVDWNKNNPPKAMLKRKPR